MRDMHAARERQGIVIVSVVDHWLRENEESFHATAASACLPACLPLQDILELYFDPATGLHNRCTCAPHPCTLPCVDSSPTPAGRTSKRAHTRTRTRTHARTCTAHNGSRFSKSAPSVAPSRQQANKAQSALHAPSNRTTLSLSLSLSTRTVYAPSSRRSRIMSCSAPVNTSSIDAALASDAAAAAAPDGNLI